MLKCLALTCGMIVCLLPNAAGADPARHSSLLGPLGLTLIPSARMDEPGTIRAGVGTLDPYMHGTLGLQIAQPLYIALRQTAEISSLHDDALRLYPGVDIKLRLLEEGAYHPELSLGWLGALGHKRMAGEYLVASKRFDNWDVSGGLGWGRYGSAHHTGNPLGLFGQHFKKGRRLDSEEPNGPENWFTGEDAGLFAGIEYSAPWVEGLSLSAEWGADRYLAEKAAFDYEAPAPWALGIHYSPRPWVNLSTGLIGGEKIMTALTLHEHVARWPGKLFRKEQPPAAAIPVAAGPRLIQAELSLPGHISSPQAIGQALQELDAQSPDTIEALEIDTRHKGLKGAGLRFNRRDVTHTLQQSAGSPQEIWRNTAINPEKAENLAPTGLQPALLNADVRFVLDEAVSLSEEDQGLLHRTGLIAEASAQTRFGLLGGLGLRLNITDNLDHLNDLRVPSLLPVRSDIDRFTEDKFALNTLYAGWVRTIAPDLHIAAAAGYLEEMYAGAGGDILYRPFGATWAIGAEGWLALKRDPDSRLHKGLSGDTVFTGHMKGYYEFPETDLTAEIRAGRYLNEDWGGTFALAHRFDHGLQVRGFMTASNQSEFDIFGGRTNVYSGLSLTLPIGNVPLALQNSIMRLSAAPFGRDAGQALANPVDLYTLTEPLSYRHITRYWNDISE
ncbi:MAG: YjbH domain-containing protein [Micavibrio aeruginosavorus]|uniref:YjbH domain-containing protein n=1 Tax=Micavibrio aeruginosavorus TaxID=349221 RepID=A0A7T5R3P1_9BACT|nr:MAG: YjbH domain-containing protein [Micavibrio aeruginosavorus]